MTVIDIANILIYISGACWSVELVPQIIKTAKNKSIKNISPLYFYISFIAYIMYIIANAILRNWVIVYSHIPGLCATSIMLFFLFKYRGK